MFKKLVTLSLVLVSALALGGRVYAAKNVTVRLEQPKSPVNQTSFNIGFVALDLLGRTVTVKCFQKGPSDGDYAQFGSSQTFANGGDSGNCAVDGSVLNDGEGTYAFRVEAMAGDGSADNSDSETTSVNYDTSGPGDVRDYSKEKNACEYKIHFKTADDNGQTVKVELYRSDAVPFNADHNSRIQSISIGSNEAKDTTDSPADCGKTYYYAVRAFDSAGNGSALVGDNVTNVTVITPTPGGRQGAIPVGGAGSDAAGSVLGQGTLGSSGATGTVGENGQVEGAETTPSGQTEETAPTTPFGMSPKRTFAIGALLVIAGLLSFYLWKRTQAA